MKKIIRVFLSVSILISIASCNDSAKKEESGYTLSGKISGLKDGTLLKLIPLAHEKVPALDSTKIEGGYFSFKGLLEGPRLVYLTADGFGGFTDILLENTKMELKANATIDSSQADFKFIEYSNVKITGSKLHNYFVESITYKDSLNNRYKAHNKKYESLIKLLSKARQTENKVAMDSIEKTDAYKALMNDESAFFSDVQKKSNNLILSNKDSWWGPMFMMYSMSYLTKEQQPLFKQFSEEAKNSFYGKLAQEELYPKSLLGTRISNFSLEDSSGKELKAYDLTAGKKYILFDFWASWCTPCRKEIPNLKKAYEKYADKGFEIVSISIDQKRDAWIKALGQENMPWPNIHDTKTVANDFLVKTIPATFLIDEKGVVINDDLRGEALEEKLAELFK